MSRRTVVFWVGEAPPAAIRRELQQRDLEVRCGTASDALKLCRAKDSPLKAVLVSYHDTLRDTLNMLYTEVLHSGSHIEVVVSDPHTYDADRLQSAIALPTFTGVIQYDGRDNVAHDVAQRCLRHDAGSSPNFALHFELQNCEITDTGQRILFQRAFADFAEIRVSPLHGGHSKATMVFRVEATNEAGHRTQPFVVKIASPSDIVEEITALNRAVVSYVPFPNRAPHIESRCVLGPKEGLLTSLFLEDAERLDIYLQKHSPAGAINAIFKGPLRNWRRDVTAQKHSLNLGNEYRHVLPKTADGLLPAYNDCSEQRDTIAPDQLFERINGIVLSVHTCYSHGDLHARNIFVDDSGNKVILIDFDRATLPERRPSALDLVVLDVSLAFDGDAGDLPLAETTMGLFEPPLLALPKPYNEATGAAANRISTIHDLRSQARGYSGCCDEPDYDVGVACALLRVAERGKVSPERRALAYNSACRLVAYASR